VANKADKRTNDSANKELAEKHQSKETVNTQTGRKTKANKKRANVEMTNNNSSSQQSLNAESSCSENKMLSQQQQQQIQQLETAELSEDKSQINDELVAAKIRKQEPASPKQSEIQSISASSLQSDTQSTNCALEKPDDSEKESNSNQSLTNQTQNLPLHQHQQQKQQTSQTIQAKVANPKFIITKINRVNASNGNKINIETLSGSSNTTVMQTATNPLVKLVTSQANSHQAKDQLVHTQPSLTS
jgi:hypothetical protein